METTETTLIDRNDTYILHHVELQMCLLCGKKRET
jgi:hypothetical protein